MVTALLALGACGEEQGVEAGATVTVYVAAQQCKGAERNLDRFGDKAGELEVEAVCLDAGDPSKRVDLAVVGANARRATEDSSSVAYLEGPGPALKFTEPILSEAEIALISTNSGATSMGRVLDLLAEWDSTEGPRQTVWEAD